MKKISYILAVAAGIAALASCNRVETFEHQTFGAFYAISYSVSEDVGTVTVPVTLTNGTGSNTLTVTAVDGTATNGTFYQIQEPASGVLTFGAGETQKNVVVKIINRPGIYDGQTRFTLKLASSDGTVTVQKYSTATISIKDNDHPLAELLGTWTAKAYGYNFGDCSWDITLSTDASDDSKIWIDYITYFWMDYKNYGAANVYGKVSADHSTITIPAEQSTSFNVGYGNQKLYNCYVDAEGMDITDDPIVFKKVSDGVYETEDGIAGVDNYVWPSYGGFLLGKKSGDYKTTWTKK